MWRRWQTNNLSAGQGTGSKKIKCNNNREPTVLLTLEQVKVKITDKFEIQFCKMPKNKFPIDVRRSKTPLINLGFWEIAHLPLP